MKKILIAFGTRPEVIKLAPVIHALKNDADLKLMHTGQHKELVVPLFSIFDFQPDYSLDIMQPGQDLFDLTERLLPKVKRVLTTEDPDFVIVQGDTTTSYLTALAAFYQKIPVLHVEAGLRSHDRYYPFPEEMNRKQISHLASYHFAPTERNKQNLLKEGIPESTIHVTGNTVIDALQFILASEAFKKHKPDILNSIPSNHQLIVLTAHRRENHGKPLENIFTAIKQLLSSHKRLSVVFPAHPNPQVTQAFKNVALDDKRLKKTAPLDYLHFLHVLKRADLIVSDSGGIQEEAAALGKPILVLRNETERQELIEQNVGELVGTNIDQIVDRASHHLKKETIVNAKNIFGDGNAAQRIKNILTQL